MMKKIIKIINNLAVNKVNHQIIIIKKIKQIFIKIQTLKYKISKIKIQIIQKKIFKVFKQIV